MLKAYSIALPLFGTLVLGGCAAPPSNPYNVPVLLGANRQQAEAILGKPMANAASSEIGDMNATYWCDPKQDYFVIIAYNPITERPDYVSFAPNSYKKYRDLETVLQVGNLRMNDPHYKVITVKNTRTVTACYGVLVTPN